MKRIHQIAAVAAALFAQAVSANTLPVNPGASQVPEPGVLGLVGIALAAAVYFGKRRK